MSDALQDAFRGKRVLVTGHTGFKGSWLCVWLKQLGADVCGYALAPPTTPSLFAEAKLEREIDHRIGDIRDSAALADVVRDVQPEIVFHLAAQAIVSASYADPRDTFATNILGTVNLYETIRQTDSVRACVCVTSDKCYENQEWPHGYRESDPMGGHDPYSASKGCAELVTSSYYRSFFRQEVAPQRPVALASARAGNVIGGGDWAANRVVPDCVRSLSADEPIVLRNPGALRPWQYVLEPLSGYLLLAGKLSVDGDHYAGGWNFGPSEPVSYTVEVLVKRIISAWGSGRYEIERKGERPHEAGVLRLDIGKASTLLRWRPRYDTAEAIDRTVRCYKAYYEGARGDALIDLMKAEISEYTTATAAET